MCYHETMGKRTYTETERIGLMVMAVEHGIPHAAKAGNMAESTIYSWLQKAGGIAQVRSFVEETEFASKLAAKSAVYRQVIKGCETGELIPLVALESFTRIVEAEAKSSGLPAPAVSITNVQAKQERYEVDPDALARAMLTLSQAGALPSGNGHNEPA
jgi:hypothetical protein